MGDEDKVSGKGVEPSVLLSDLRDSSFVAAPPIGQQQHQNLDSDASNAPNANQVPPSGQQQLPQPPNPDQWSLQGYRQFVAPAAPKLAPITIPIFNGEWKEWTTFIGLFDSLIDANPYLAPVQKLQYLLNYLQGEAKEAIDHILLCNENYSIAMDILRRRFDNKRKICDEYVSKLLNLPKMESATAAGIINISNVITLSLHGLQRYKYDTSSWAPVVVACVTSSLDEESRQKFEESLENSREVPTIAILLAFLDRRHQVLLSEPRPKTQAPVRKNSYTSFTQGQGNKRGQENSTRSCILCLTEGHHIRQCDQFLMMSIPDRIQCAKSKRLCFNCLGDHRDNCGSRFTCRICNQKHHSLLHLGNQQRPSDDPHTTHSHVANKGDNVLLATALVKVRNLFGQHETLRALIDPGSQDSFITSATAQSLSLTKTKANVQVSGIGGSTAGKILGQVDLNLRPHFPTQLQFQTTALILPTLTARLPERRLAQAVLPTFPNNIIMADPAFDETGPIDLILGAGPFAEIVKEGLHKFNGNQLLLQNTALGWILSGRLPEPVRQSHSLITVTELDAKTKAFWEMKEEPPQPIPNRLNSFSDRTTTCDTPGSHIVHLPKRDDTHGDLGASRNLTIARPINLEKSIPPFAGPESGAFYLPHHAVIEKSSTTTKGCVVFNASFKTHTGRSLNRLLDPDHKQQQDPHQIILRWRTHQFVIIRDPQRDEFRIRLNIDDFLRHQLTLSVLRRPLWFSNGRSTVQAVIRSCTRCRRFAVASQMGDLPSAQITAAPAFYRTGADYCGPSLYHLSKGREIKIIKGYIAVFVCFSTKAVHLELVSDLTTDAYLAAFKRFVARRSLPLEVHSYNGTNFRDACSVLDQPLKEAVQEATELAASLLANDGVTWNFSPTSTPHLGGLWEAGAKSVKTHLKRVLDNTKLTYEELANAVCQIETFLNSRPLCPISNDPEDLSALTPGHFLTTRPLLAPPEPVILDANPEQLCHAALPRPTPARFWPYRTRTAIIAILLMLLTAFHLGSATPLVSVQPGLYLERLGHCQLRSGTLRLQVDHPISEMNVDAHHLNDLNNNLSALFNQWHFRHDAPPAESSLYQQMIERFQRKSSHAVERINDLKSTRQRSRRGLFGKLMTTVFGVNDDVYAELSVLRKEQIVNSQSNLRVTTTVEKNLHDMKLRRQEVDENLRRTSALIQSLSAVAHRHIITNHLMAAYTVAASFLDDLSYKYDALAKAAIGLGSILDILPLKHINEALRNATDRIPIGLYVRPVPDDHLDAHFTSDKLILRAYFPIAATSLFDLVHVTPIPDFRNDTFIVPDLTSRTIALNYLDQTFFELTEGQLAACRLMSERTYLCETSVLSVMNFTGCSILNEIYNRTSPQSCPYTALHINGVLWQKLLMPNAWLFTTHPVTVVAMICQSKREDLRLVGSGIIQLPDGCIIKTPSYNIGSLVLLDVHVLETFVKAATISEYPPVIRNRIELLDPPPFTNPAGLVADIPAFNSTISPYEPPHIGLHFAWSAIVILVAGLVYLRLKKKKTPQPRAAPTRRHSAPSLTDRIDSMLSSLAPEHVQP